jgi:hypothetical protein
MSAWLRSQLDRAADRLRYAERELDRADHLRDSDDPRDQRTLRKLEADLELAEKDYAWAKQRLDDAAGEDVFSA